MARPNLRRHPQKPRAYLLVALAAGAMLLAGVGATLMIAAGG